MANLAECSTYEQFMNHLMFRCVAKCEFHRNGIEICTLVPSFNPDSFLYGIIIHQHQQIDDAYHHQENIVHLQMDVLVLIHHTENVVWYSTLENMMQYESNCLRNCRVCHHNNIMIDVKWKHLNVCFSQVNSACASITAWLCWAVCGCGYETNTWLNGCCNLFVHAGEYYCIWTWLQLCIVDLEVHLFLLIPYCNVFCVATTMTDQLGIVQEILVKRLADFNKYATSTPIPIVTRKQMDCFDAFTWHCEFARMCHFLEWNFSSVFYHQHEQWLFILSTNMMLRVAVQRFKQHKRNFERDKQHRWSWTQITCYGHRQYDWWCLSCFYRIEYDHVWVYSNHFWRLLWIFSYKSSQNVCFKHVWDRFGKR